MTPWFLAAFVLVGAPGRDLPFSINSGGTLRDGIVYLPGKVSEPRKLVILLHGNGGDAKGMLKLGKWREHADEQGVVLLSLNGLPGEGGPTPNARNWASGGGDTASDRNKVDDVKFISDSIDRAAKDYGINSKSVFVSGFSNGAMMTWRVGMELSNKIRAIAPVAGMFVVKPKPLKKKVPAMFFYGELDPVSPIGGGEVVRNGKTFMRPSADKSWKTWAQLNNITSKPEDNMVPRLFDVKDFVSKDRKVTISFVRIYGAGHVWPGGESDVSESFSGPMVDRPIVTKMMLDFFGRVLAADPQSGV